ncbi:MAG: hypothetical protein LLF86_02580 [Nitrospiraceae bacterium]|nr:hypothetical protein [Nitrospiraceae bacterium]
MPRKIAMLARQRQAETFRMSAGLIMMDDIIDIFVLDRKIDEDEKTQANFELVQDMGLNVYTNCADNKGIEYISTEDIANKLLEYDFVDPC